MREKKINISDEKTDERLDISFELATLLKNVLNMPRKIIKSILLGCDSLKTGDIIIHIIHEERDLILFLKKY